MYANANCLVAGGNREARIEKLQILKTGADNLAAVVDAGCIAPLSAGQCPEIDRPVEYRPVESDGARRAAELIAPLI